MAGRETARIARDLTSQPHVRGRRIGVRQVSALAEEGDEDVEDRFDLDVADVYHTLAYYHEMREVADEKGPSRRFGGQ